MTTLTNGYCVSPIVYKQASDWELATADYRKRGWTVETNATVLVLDGEFIRVVLATNNPDCVFVEPSF